MKFCYVDESGIGDEPYAAVMVGVIVDSHRMRPTKRDWDDLLSDLSNKLNHRVDEIHTRDFYAGNGRWRNIDGPQRASIIGAIFDWLASRKHTIVFSSLDKTQFAELEQHPFFSDIKTIWRFLGLHLVLAIQKHHQPMKKNKGNTVLVFDNEERERERFTDLVLKPPAWTDSYYSRGKKQDPVDQLVDAPYFADSRDVALLQLADFIAYFLRRYAELENGDRERYAGERLQVAGWARQALACSIRKAAMYPKRNRCECADFFYGFATPCLRDWR